MTRIALVVISDGRVGERFDFMLERTIASIEENLDVPFVRKVIVDDSGLLPVYLQVQQQYPDYEVIHHRHRWGIVAAVHTGWHAALETDAEYVWHQEQDFTFNGLAPIDNMVRLLDTHEHLAHLVLKRDPYSPEEHQAGDFMRLNPAMYHDCHSDIGNWVEVDGMFSCNPSLIRRKAIEVAEFNREAAYAQTLERAGYRCAFYGKTTDPPRVTHIGAQRALGWKP